MAPRAGPPAGLAALTATPGAVLLLHGQPGGPRDFDRVVALLSGLRVLTPVRPGYDGRPAAGFYANAAAALDELDRERVDRAVLVGFSWGGGVALAAALRAPERVAGLVLVSSVGTAAAVGPADRLLAQPPVSRLVARLVVRLGQHVFPLVLATTGSRLPRPVRREIGRRVAETDLVAAARAWQVEQSALVRETPALQRQLPHVRIPAVVLAGRRDRMVRAAAGRSLARLLPNARYREVADAGHLLLLERPDVVAAAVRELLAT